MHFRLALNHVACLSSFPMRNKYFTLIYFRETGKVQVYVVQVAEEGEVEGKGN